MSRPFPDASWPRLPDATRVLSSHNRCHSTWLVDRFASWHSVTEFVVSIAKHARQKSHIPSVNACLACLVLHIVQSTFVSARPIISTENKLAVVSVACSCLGDHSLRVFRLQFGIVSYIRLCDFARFAPTHIGNQTPVQFMLSIWPRCFLAPSWCFVPRSGSPSRIQLPVAGVVSMPIVPLPDCFVVFQDLCGLLSYPFLTFLRPIIYSCVLSG